MKTIQKTPLPCQNSDCNCFDDSESHCQSHGIRAADVLCDDYVHPEIEPAGSNNGWFQIKDCDELSIGEYYFYYSISDKMVALAEFDGNSFSCEAETVDFDVDFAYGDFWFKEFSWPNPPQV